MLTSTEENYLKALFHLTTECEGKVHTGTNELAEHLDLKPATVNSMLKKLAEKKLIYYAPYTKVSLTPSGKKRAVEIVQKHRLWETFLYEHLDFTWDEVHEVAEQLEHIRSTKLIERLNRFLGYPKFDPHGDPIPTSLEFKPAVRRTLLQAPFGKMVQISAVNDESPAFLKYLMKLGLALGTKLKVVEQLEFDQSLILHVNNKQITVSEKFAGLIYIE